MAITPTTWNPADKDATVTLSGGDLIADSAYGSVRSTASVISGKYYWELTFPSGITQQRVGVGTSGADISYYPGFDSNSWALDLSSRVIENNGSVVGSLSVVTATTVSVLLDADAQTVAFWADGVPASSAIALTAGPYYAIYGYYAPIEANFGASPFTYTPPAGYESGLGTGAGPTISASGVKVVVAGTPSILFQHPVTVSATGAKLSKFGNVAVIAGPNRVTQVSGASATKTGTPALVDGPNRISRVSGAACFSSGAVSLQLGYPETIELAGASVASAGTPVAFPYSNKRASVAGVALLRVGSPSILYSPIVAGNRVAQVAGRNLTNTGKPVLVGDATAQVPGATAFAAGTPAVRMTLRPTGVSVLTAGAPSAGGRLSPPGARILRAGAPKLSTTVRVMGVSFTKVGTPAATGTAAIIAPGGPALFSAGAPSAGAVLGPWGKTHCRSGVPTISRGGAC